MSEYRLNVYEAINQVSLAMSRDGITKARQNEQQGYAFRGIDDMYNALSIPLASIGLCIIPRFRNRTVTERVTQKGGTLFYVTVEGEFDLVGPDGSKHTALAYGEAMDSGDKATNKAMSAAFKYMCMQIFCIPTEGDNDADATTHELQARADAVAQRRIKELTPAKVMAPEGIVPSNVIIELANSLDAPRGVLQEPTRTIGGVPIVEDHSYEQRSAVKQQEAMQAAKPTPGLENTAKRKRGAISFTALKAWGEIKKEILALTGTTDLYYEALKAGGYQHADEIKTQEDAAKIWKALKAITAELGRSKQDKALMLEVEAHALRIGPYATQAALERRGLKSIEEVLQVPNGTELDALLKELRETA